MGGPRAAGRRLVSERETHQFFCPRLDDEVVERTATRRRSRGNRRHGRPSPGAARGQRRRTVTPRCLRVTRREPPAQAGKPGQPARPVTAARSGSLLLCGAFRCGRGSRRNASGPQARHRPRLGGVAPDNRRVRASVRQRRSRLRPVAHRARRDGAGGGPARRGGRAGAAADSPRSSPSKSSAARSAGQ